MSSRSRGAENLVTILMIDNDDDDDDDAAVKEYTWKHPDLIYLVSGWVKLRMMVSIDWVLIWVYLNTDWGENLNTPFLVDDEKRIWYKIDILLCMCCVWLASVFQLWLFLLHFMTMLFLNYSQPLCIGVFVHHNKNIICYNTMWDECERKINRNNLSVHCLHIHSKFSLFIFWIIRKWCGMLSGWFHDHNEF